MANYNCTISHVGVSNAGGTAIALTAVSGEFKTKWFNLPEVAKKEMLAASLSALSTNMIVRIDIDPAKLAAADWPTINWLEVTKE